MKNVLIVGGTSSISPFLCKDLEENGYTINLISYRNVNKINLKYNWQYLNLENIDSINNFISNINSKYKKIIILSGNALEMNYLDLDFQKIKMYYESYLFNYIYLCYNLFKFLDHDGQLVTISSVAANTPYQDFNLSAVKGGIQSFTRSLSLHAKDSQAVFCIAPPTITDDIRKNISEIILNANSFYNGILIELEKSN